MKAVNIFLTIVILGVGFSSCSKDDKDDSSSHQVVLSETQKTHLVNLYEEEKLAHDLYTEFYAAHGYTPFSHHIEAEAKHMTLVDEVLTLYGISRATLGFGLFENEGYQKNYNEWLAKGVSDSVHSCYIAAYIEEMDILDLMEGIQLAETTEIKDLNETLKSGSENHLRAYNKFLKMEFNIDYTPQLMSQELFDKIISEGGSGHGGGK
ncbi:DUF2202 domain-containing protein [Owenweeksia hongkongensis]|uniref:DUF2202 domain-containing protein n=1 Tax=Owenweeksia hongkongensis TaxID=253245 RepID=UPI003A931D99